MSGLWIALWAGLSIFIMGVFIWTTRALISQKQAWGAFARRRGFKWNARKWLQGPVLTGRIGDYDVYISSEERDRPGLKGRLFVTILQLSTTHIMPGSSAIGTGDYGAFVDGMGVRDELLLPFSDPDVIARVTCRSEDAAQVQEFWTDHRTSLLENLIKQSRINILFLFDKSDVLFRVETVDPMLKDGQLDKLLEGTMAVLRGIMQDV